MTAAETSECGEDRFPAGQPPEATEGVARVWSYRRRVELEAADQFQRLSADLVAAYGRTEISDMAEAAGHDELMHASYCEKIIGQCGRNVPQPKPQLGCPLGPAEFSVRRRALYAAVALSCVTETLSTALLVRMQIRAKFPLVRDVVHTILEDEISHSRLGWAQLAQSAREEEVNWLGPYLPAMIGGAIISDVKPMISDTDLTDLASFGILPSREAREIMLETIHTVILPGFRTYGIATDKAQTAAGLWLGRQ